MRRAARVSGAKLTIPVVTDGYRIVKFRSMTGSGPE